MKQRIIYLLRTGLSTSHTWKAQMQKRSSTNLRQKHMLSLSGIIYVKYKKVNILSYYTCIM